LDEFKRVMSHAFVAESVLTHSKMLYANVLWKKAPSVQNPMHKMASHEVVKRERVQLQAKEAEATGKLSYAKVLRVETIEVCVHS
jgi:hypothetical protein